MNNLAFIGVNSAYDEEENLIIPLEIFKQGELVEAFEDTGNFILARNNKQILYRLGKDEKGKIITKAVFEANEIKKIPESHVLFEVWKGRRRGVCTKNGLLVISFRWQLFKRYYEKVDDIYK